MVEAYPEEKRQTLFKWNIVAGILHAIQAFTQLILALTVDDFKNFKLPIRNYFWKEVITQNGDEFLETVSSLLGNAQIGPMIFIFFFLSAFFHFLVCIPRFNKIPSAYNFSI